MSTHLIVSSYQKDLYWTLKLLKNRLVDRIYIYEHSDLKISHLPEESYTYENIPNKSCEASAYLKYICDNYDKLPEKIILIHDEEYAWHHTGSILNLIQMYNGEPYLNINHYRWSDDTIPFSDKNGDYYKWYQTFLEPYFGPVEKYGNFHGGHLGCAQFILKPEVITKNPKKMYIDLYNYSVSDNVQDGHNSGGFGYFMEYTWHLIFGKV